jgi:hypothetical protein
MQVRQHDVAQQQVNLPRMRSRNAEGRVGVTRREHGVALRFEHPHGQPLNGGLVD